MFRRRGGGVGLVGVVVAGRGGREEAANYLDEEFLRVAGAEVEANGLEDEALEADDDLARRFEYLDQGKNLSA